MNTSWIGGAVLLACAPLASAAVPAELQRLDATIERARAEFDIPGIAVAVAKDGKVVVTQGFGVRKLGDPTPVDGKTIFEIASNSKAFTAAGLAMLVDQGKLDLDAPASR
ncbi:MAG TPA: serine hydrolase, partial [Stenotrophomonas sp.]|nr:serine hydrolase [Stenotrophomonas sp.]